jgi:hypothetical protein
VNETHVLGDYHNTQQRSAARRIGQLAAKATERIALQTPHREHPVPKGGETSAALGRRSIFRKKPAAERRSGTPHAEPGRLPA